MESTVFLFQHGLSKSCRETLLLYACVTNSCAGSLSQLCDGRVQIARHFIKSNEEKVNLEHAPLEHAACFMDQKVVVVSS